MNYILKRISKIDININKVTKLIKRNNKLLFVMGGMCFVMYTIMDDKVSSLKRRISILESDISHLQDAWFNNIGCSDDEKGASEE